MTTFTKQTKSSNPAWSKIARSGSEIIYLVCEALDHYLIGASSNETLVTTDVINWNKQNKS